MPSDTRVLEECDDDYPADLRLLKPAPRLTVRGALPITPGVAIVGTRDASPGALAFTRALARDVVQGGLAVFSGGALGIDAAAHESVLAAGGITVVVIGTGIQQCYPPAHRDLYDRIVASGGAVVSHLADEQPAAHWTFLARNRVLAALARATVVVEAPLESGARSAAAAARRLGRPLFVVPGAPWDERTAGNFAEIEAGAQVYRGPLSLLEAIDPARAALAAARSARQHTLETTERAELARVRRATRRQSAPAPSSVTRAGRARGEGAGSSPSVLADPDALAVYRAARERPNGDPVHLDWLCEKTGWPPPRVQQALLTLTLEAVLVEGPAGWFRMATYRK